jgi:hypothetical protein
MNKRECREDAARRSWEKYAANERANAKDNARAALAERALQVCAQFGVWYDDVDLRAEAIAIAAELAAMEAQNG